MSRQFLTVWRQSFVTDLTIARRSQHTIPSNNNAGHSGFPGPRLSTSSIQQLQFWSQLCLWQCSSTINIADAHSRITLGIPGSQGPNQVIIYSEPAEFFPLTEFSRGRRRNCRVIICRGPMKACAETFLAFGRSRASHARSGCGENWEICISLRYFCRWQWWYRVSSLQKMTRTMKILSVDPGTVSSSQGAPRFSNWFSRYCLCQDDGLSFVIQDL